MRFGVFLTNQYPLGADMRLGLAEQIEAVRTARDLGFDSVWTGQHYLTAGMTMLQPLPFLARIVPEAGDMTIGLGINLLALHNPLEVAENYATLDVISGGRLVFGVGLGYRDDEYAAFGIGKTGRVKRFEANLAALRSLWSGGEVDIDEPWCRIQGSLKILPVQAQVPIWMAANNDPAVERAGRLADAWMINPHATHDTIARQLDLYRAARDTAGLGAPAEQPAIREVYCAQTRAEALDAVRPHLTTKYGAYNDWGQHKALPGDERFDIPFDELLAGRFIIGAPDDCIAQLLRWRDELGVDHLVFRTHWVGLANDAALASMRLLAREVFPALRAHAE